MSCKHIGDIVILFHMLSDSELMLISGAHLSHFTILLTIFESEQQLELIICKQLWLLWHFYFNYDVKKITVLTVFSSFTKLSVPEMSLILSLPETAIHFEK